MGKHQVSPQKEPELSEKLWRSAIRLAERWYWKAAYAVVMGVLTALLWSQGISFLEGIITRTGVKPLSPLRTLGLMFVVVTTNLVVAARTYKAPLDPQTDLRLYSHVWSKLGDGRASEFLVRFYRMSCPLELKYTDRMVVNTIEGRIPLALFFAGMGIVILAPLAAAIWTGLVVYSGELDRLIVPVVLVSMVFVFEYAFAIEGFREDLKFYRLWKEFWSGYWRYVAGVLDTNRLVDTAVTRIDSWSRFIGWRWVGQHVDYSSPKLLDDLKKRAAKTMKKMSISDTLPTETLSLFKYFDRLVLCSDLKQVVDQEGKTSKSLLEKIPELGDAIKYLSDLDTLANDFAMPCLEECKKVLSVLPIGRLSAEAAHETLVLGPALTQDVTEIREMAEKRLDHLSNLSNHPLPESVKWIGATYAVVSLIMTWLGSLGVP